MVRRVVIHAGFHKTGTTTVQRMLHANGPVLWPRMALGLRWRLKPVLAAARGYSVWRDPVSLALVGERFDAYLAALELGKRRHLCVSSEELSGHLPGRDGIERYDAAPKLMAEIERSVRRQYPEAHLIFYFSTRNTEQWLRSAWAEHVKSSRMTIDLSRFVERFRAAADFTPVLDAIADAVAPAPLVVQALEDTRGRPLGPADPLIDLMDLNPRIRAALRPHRAVNRALSDDMLDTLLEINRSSADDAVVRDRKAEILAPFRAAEAAR